MIIINDEMKTNLNLDTGYMFGKGVFETILVVKGQGILLKEHLTRLNAGIKFLNLPQKIKLDDVLKKITYFYTALKEKKFVLKINVSEQNIIYSTRKYNYSKKDYEKASLGISSVRKGKSIINKFKTTNCLENTLELAKGRELGNIDTIFLNLHEEILEGCISNIFFLSKEELITPPLNLSILNGVIRNWVINNFKVTEKIVTKDFLKKADGIFITNSLVGIMPIYKIEDRIIDSIKNPKIKTISQAYFSAWD